MQKHFFSLQKINICNEYYKSKSTYLHALYYGTHKWKPRPDQLYISVYHVFNAIIFRYETVYNRLGCIYRSTGSLLAGTPSDKRFII